LASTSIRRRSSIEAPLRTAPWNFPMALIIFGWWAQISIGSMPVPRAGSPPVICLTLLRMNR
jgi:hypothetical protein